MKITTLPNGNLEMKLIPSEIPVVKRIRKTSSSEIYAELQFIEEFLQGEGFEQIQPEDCGALTDAPLIRRSETQENLEVWGFLDYQVTNFLEVLANGKSVVFQKG